MEKRETTQETKPKHVKGMAMRRRRRSSRRRTRRARFEEGVPADPTKNMSPEEAAEWEAMNEEYGDKFKKDKESRRYRRRRARLRRRKRQAGGSTFKCPECDTKVLEETGYCVKCQKKVSKESRRKRHSSYPSDFIHSLKASFDLYNYSDGHMVMPIGSGMDIADLPDDGGVELVQYQLDRLPPKAAREVKESQELFLQIASRHGISVVNARAASVTGINPRNRRHAKFPKGKPADPTQNMTPEQAAEWEAMNEEYGDKFKKDSGRQRMSGTTDTLYEAAQSARLEGFDRRQFFDAAEDAYYDGRGMGETFELLLQAADTAHDYGEDLAEFLDDVEEAWGLMWNKMDRGTYFH